MATASGRSTGQGTSDTAGLKQRVKVALETDDVDALRATGQGAVGVVKVRFEVASRWWELNGMGKACELGAMRIVKWLVACGETMSMAGQRGVTALHCACAGGHVELAQWLVSQGLMSMTPIRAKRRRYIVLAS